MPLRTGPKTSPRARAPGAPGAAEGGARLRAWAGVGGVADPDRPRVVAVGDDAEDRPEDLLARDDGGVVEVREQGRSHEPSPVQSCGRPGAAGDHAGAEGAHR